MREDFVDQLAAASREAKDVLGELRSELREVRAQRKALAEERAAAEAMVRRAVKDELAEAVRTQLEEIGPTFKEHADHLYDRLTREAQRLTNLALYGNEQGRGPNILDEIRGRLNEAKARQL